MPSTQIIKRTTCYPCEHLKSQMLKSGRDPIYTHYCKHPASANYEFMKTSGRLIGEHDDQPVWCPLLQIQQNDQKEKAWKDIEDDPLEDGYSMIYVDQPDKPYGRMLMCHMVSIDTNELHEMADKIGVSRRWFQGKSKYPHYDICKSKRALAVKYGAIEVESQAIINMFRDTAKE